jgi:membrane protein implicated in regulation of membrane protease activity
MKAVLKLLALSADEIIVGLFLILVLPAFGITVPLWAVASVIAFLLAKDLLVAPFIMGGGLSSRPEVGPESLTGKKAVTLEDLNPEGLVKVNGEFWSAECVNGSARRGEVVEIVGVKGARVFVKRS